MTDFDAYRNIFPHAKLTRSKDGVLEIVLHTDGDTLVFNGYTHEEFVDLFHQIGQDVGNRVVILTGAGNAFIDRIDAEGFDFFSPRGYDKIYREGKKVLSNLLDIPVGSQRKAQAGRSWSASSMSFSKGQDQFLDTLLISALSMSENVMSLSKGQ